MRAVEWGNPQWGMPGHNVHEDPLWILHPQRAQGGVMKGTPADPFLISVDLFRRMTDAVYATVDSVDGWLFADIQGTSYMAAAVANPDELVAWMATEVTL